MRHDHKIKQHRKTLLHSIQTLGWDQTMERIAAIVDFLTLDEINDAIFEYLRK